MKNDSASWENQKIETQQMIGDEPVDPLMGTVLVAILLYSQEPIDDG